MKIFLPIVAVIFYLMAFVALILLIIYLWQQIHKK